MGGPWRPADWGLTGTLRRLQPPAQDAGTTRFDLGARESVGANSILLAVLDRGVQSSINARRTHREPMGSRRPTTAFGRCLSKVMPAPSVLACWPQTPVADSAQPWVAQPSDRSRLGLPQARTPPPGHAAPSPASSRRP